MYNNQLKEIKKENEGKEKKKINSEISKKVVMVSMVCIERKLEAKYFGKLYAPLYVQHCTTLSQI